MDNYITQARTQHENKKHNQRKMMNICKQQVQMINEKRKQDYSKHKYNNNNAYDKQKQLHNT